MKNILFLFLIFLNFQSFAKIRRVSNNVGVVAVPNLVYVNTSSTSTSNAFAQAYNDASNGDTLYLEPSTLFYSTGNGIEKQLVIIGNGYRISDNSNLVSPLPQNLLSSLIRGFTSGGGPTVDIKPGAEGSVFLGLEFISTLNVNTNSILIERCLFSGNTPLTINSNNNIVKQTHITNFNLSGTGQNNTYTNCIFSSVSSINSVFDNCTIESISNTSSCVFTNCIVINSINNNANTFSHSLKIGGTFPTSGINNNVENVTLSDVFTSPNPLNPGDGLRNFDKNFRLKVGSPANGIGIAGTNVGAFGGSNPYRLSGEPAIPIITNFFLSTTGSTASGLSGSITIQSNN
jgi:hypothetical protein